MKKHFLLLTCLLAVGTLCAQTLFEGVATYRMSMNGMSAQNYTVYYRGKDQLTDMPMSKMRILYLSEEKKMYTIMSMMGKPIVSSHDYDADILFDAQFDDTLSTEDIDGHHCLRIEIESDNDMMAGKVTVWLDTSYYIPSEYGRGLPVRKVTHMQMNGRSFESVSELVSVVQGKVDDALFVVPSEGVVSMSVDDEGNPVISGDTTGMYAPVHTKGIKAVDSVGFRKAVAKGKVVCMMTATWCGPCRLMYPRLENVAKRLGKGYRFIKFDIDQSYALAREFDAMTIPVVILFENGREVRRITSAAHSEEDIYKFIVGEK
ncbi:MAG: thioredoxin family protein [Bacteroidales bacterium]|nr:thioredoxin family protein [Bacteroidales bacterium]MBQ5993556.1 thioredoxin family protein [Bacteroidales bacterium]